MKSDDSEVPSQRFNVISIIIIVVFGILLSLHGYVDYKAVINNGKRAAEQIADNTALITEGNLNETQQILGTMEYFVLSNSIHSKNKYFITKNLIDLKSKNTYIMDLLVVSPDGIIRYWTGIGDPPDIHDREYFTFHQHHSSGSLYVGPPQLSKVHQDQWFFAISKATEHESVNLRYILVAIVDVSALHNKLSTHLAMPRSTQVLLSPKGQIYTRTPDHNLYVGKMVSIDDEISRLVKNNSLTVIR